MCSSNQKRLKKYPGTLPDSQLSWCTLRSNPTWSYLCKCGLIAGLMLVLSAFGRGSTSDSLKSSLNSCGFPVFLGPLDGSSPFPTQGSRYLFAPAQQLCQAQVRHASAFACCLQHRLLVELSTRVALGQCST